MHNALARDIRTYAMRDTRSLRRDRNSMVCLEHCLVESFLDPRDWEEHGLWSVEWRTFALIVAESLDNNEARYFHALQWALGAGDEFAERKEGQGAYWWRDELQRRAGLYWDGKRFIEARGVVPGVTP